MKQNPGRKERRQEQRMALLRKPPKRLRRKKHGIPEHTFRKEAGLSL